MARDHGSRPGPEERWSIPVPREKMKELGADRRFQIAVRLARVVNAFRFCHSAAVEFGGVPGSPSNDRQRHQSFLFTCGLLYEAFDVVQEVGRELKNLGAYREEMVPLMRDAAVRRIRKHDLRLLRNKVVFHFDDEVVEMALPLLEAHEAEFLDGLGPSRGSIYFPLADLVGIRYILSEQEARSDDPGTDLSESERLEQLIRDVTVFQLRFCDAAEVLITEILQGVGLKGGPKHVPEE